MAENQKSSIEFKSGIDIKALRQQETKMQRGFKNVVRGLDKLGLTEDEKNQVSTVLTGAYDRQAKSTFGSLLNGNGAPAAEEATKTETPAAAAAGATEGSFV